MATAAAASGRELAAVRAATGGSISMSAGIRSWNKPPARHHLDGSREERGGRTVYRIQWVTERGERRDYIVDGQTGAVMAAAEGMNRTCAS